MKKFLKYLLIILGIVYAGICAAVYFGQEVLIFHPYPLAEEHEFQFIRPFEEMELKMEDGVSLNAIRFTLDRPSGIVIFWHGNTGNVEVCSPIAGQFLSRGYEVLVVDYRGYGKSEGKRTQENLYSDGLAVYDILRAEYPGDEIVVYGQSLGSGIATYIASQREVGHLLLEAPYASIQQVAAAQYPWLPTSLLLKFPMPTHEYIDSVKAGITIFHGTDDEVIPFAQAEQLANENKLARLVTLEGGGHNSCTLFTEYQEALDEALLGYVREDQNEVVVRPRKKKHLPTNARADSLQVYFDHTAENYNVDSLWLLYFRTFPRSFDEFVRVYGTADTSMHAPIQEDASIHLQIFFEQVASHRQIRPEKLFVDLAVQAKDIGGPVNDLRKGIQDAFLTSDSLLIEELSTRPKTEQTRFWKFYLTDLLITDAVEMDLSNRLFNHPKMLGVLTKLLSERIDIEERDSMSTEKPILHVADSLSEDLSADSLDVDSLPIAVDSLK